MYSICDVRDIKGWVPDFCEVRSSGRDAPVSVLVKIVRLSIISLEQLLTTTIEPNDIAPLDKINKEETVQTQSIDFKDGQETFKDPDYQELMMLKNEF